MTAEGKVVVVTGASAGIGAALAEELARRACTVVLVARREDALGAVAARCSGRALVAPADVTVREQVRRVVRDAVAQVGRIDVWVNNAGRGISRMPSELTAADLDEMMDVNVKAALYGMQEVLPHFKARGTGQIVNVSSMLGRMPLVVPRAAYCGAKHFLNALTAAFRHELEPVYPDIVVSLVSPGIVRTEFGVNARYGGPDSRLLLDSQSAEEVALVIADVIESRRPDIYTRPGSHDRVVTYFDTIAEDP